MTQSWTKETLLNLSSGFLKSRIFLSAVELNLFGKLSKAPRNVAELCQEEGWDARGLAILLDALAAMGLISKSPGGAYGLPPSLSRLLVEGTEESILPMIRHQGHMWRRWSNLSEIVRAGTNENGTDTGFRSDDETDAFIGAMHVVARGMAETVAGSIDLSHYRRMLDVGGGPGTYTIAFLKKAPQMRATLFDLPPVVEIARKRLHEAGFIDRVDIVAGDYDSDGLPAGHDLALLSAIIHSESRSGNRTLYEKVDESLLPGGAILIRDHIMDATRTVPEAGALFAVNMLVATEGGSTYTFDEVREDLERTGFKNVRMIRQGQQMDQLVSATKE